MGERDELYRGEAPTPHIRNQRFSLQEAQETTTTTSGWSFWLLMAGLTTTIGGSLPVGFNIGVLNSPAQIIKQFCNESISENYGLSMSPGQLEVLWSAVVSIFLIGGVSGSLSGSWLADRIGRKGAYVTSTILHLVGGVLFYTSKPMNSVEFLLIGRLLVGFAGGLITSVVPMYLTELAPLRLRGALGVLCPFGLTFGVLVGQVMGLRELLGRDETWPDLISLYALLVLICAVITPFLPESPKYLYVIKNQPQMALKQLSKIRGLPLASLSDEVADLQMSLRVTEESGVSWNLKTVLTNKELLLPILLVCAMQAGQQLSGINAVFYYSVSIFQKTGLNEQQCQLANIGCGCVNLLMGVVSVPLMSHCNRRTLFLLSCITASFWLIVLGLSIIFIKSVFWMPYISIVAVLFYVLFYGFGLGPIPYFIGSELFEVGPRPSAMALGSMANWGANFMVGMSFPSLQNFIGAGSFGIFATITICLFFFIKTYFPETRGKNPYEVGQLCKYGLKSRPLATPASSSDTAATASAYDLKNSN